MGRSIPSISYRLDEKMRQWERFTKLLPREGQEAFASLIPLIRNRRSAIDAADESDIGVAILLAIIVEMRGEINELKKREVGRGTKDKSEDRDALP